MSYIIANTDKIVAIVIMLTGSVYIRILLQIIGQNWVKTISHTATLMLLPVLTYVITSVISGNIALSLGMVGALSIVRFRNPVRSPLELSIYFGAITMGITAAVSITWLVFLLAAVTLVALGLAIMQFVSERIFSNPFFITSFSEGNTISSLIISSRDEIKELDENQYLIAKNTCPDAIEYSLACADFKRLQKIEQRCRSFGSIISTQLSR